MTYTVNFNVLMIIIFFAPISSHPFMKTGLIIEAIATFIWHALQFDAALVSFGALNADALAADSSSNYAKKALSAPVNVQRAVLFLVMALGTVVQVLLVAKY